MLILSQKLANANCHLPKGQVAFFLPDSPFLDGRLSFHTDLRVFAHGDTLICAPSVVNILKATLPSSLNIISSAAEPTGKYPLDAPLNGVCAGRYLIANPATIDRVITDYCKEKGLTLIPVKQGYCRCNVTVVSDKAESEAIITEDVGIAKAATAKGIDVLLIPVGGVRLTGWDHGFIGGASLTTEKEVIFFGDLALHPQGKDIIVFCKKYGKVPHSLIEGAQLFDYGGGISL